MDRKGGFSVDPTPGDVTRLGIDGDMPVMLIQIINETPHDSREDSHCAYQRIPAQGDRRKHIYRLHHGRMHGREMERACPELFSGNPGMVDS